MGESRIIEVRSVLTQEDANKLLQEGWDLFAAVAKPPDVGGWGPVYVLVRRELPRYGQRQ
ncbi:MAG: hypothetical protein M3198_00625 [Actinomycetota bacterium]|nr:hypothetical protein [Actinomycetota bacterium]